MLGIIATTYLSIIKKSWKFSFLLLWLLITIIPPHIIGTRLYWYMLPAIPALFLSSFASFVYVKQTYFSKNKVLPIIIIILVSIHIINVGRRTTQYIREYTKTEKKEFIQNTLKHIPKKEKTIVLYNTQGWYQGLIMPSWYWYLHFEHNKEPIYTDEPFLAHRIDRFTQYPYWITDVKGLESLDTFSEQFSYEPLHTNNEFTLVKINLK